LDCRQEDCYEQERKDLFLPMFANCSECRGYVFKGGGASSVVAQLGCCGCLVAAEMEIVSASKSKAPPSPTSPTPLKDALTAARLEAKQALRTALEDAMISARLDVELGEHKTQKPAEHYYLHALRRQPSARRRPTRVVPTTQMKTRNRQFKGPSR
jgi:hypothetical protein